MLNTHKSVVLFTWEFILSENHMPIHVYCSIVIVSLKHQLFSNYRLKGIFKNMNFCVFFFLPRWWDLTEVQWNIKKFFSQYFFKYISVYFNSCTFHPYWDSEYIKLHFCCDRWLNSLLLNFLFCSDWVISVNLSWNWVILFSVISKYPMSFFFLNFYFSSKSPLWFFIIS